ncbi:serine/threonine-protein kinase [Nocardioides aurantiacus]|uniref:non-specific serine/threonine protein kinase n=1 Tax=Nocardioides aurantiacus TaxID=86796 RepID=A0A3N2CVY8_9ACTN|nr:serine/threonine-protein kinase [Nocardioides aurantiacus]ROR91701.1 hypothetical protein EDD33_2574 [Nocardioides aurantiacus]
MQPELIGGRYRVEDVIGRGGMGTVWSARDETLHRVVAVKQVGRLPGESVTDSARALREARSSAGLNHPHVVTVFDVVEEAGHLWLVMELVPGRSLSQIIKQDGPLEPAAVADLGAQVADGLAALHAEGTVHRDVKPGNVLVRHDGVAKISDFGIARTAGDATLTHAGSMTGTPTYFSPSLARGGSPAPEDDVWALGATLYAAVEGRPPYEQQPNPIAVLHEIVSSPPAPPTRAGVLTQALEGMLDRDPGSRWSMDEAAHVLRRVADQHRGDATLHQTREQTRAAAAAAPRPTPQPSRQRAEEEPRRTAPVVIAATPPSGPRRGDDRSRHRAWPLVLAALLVVGLVAGAWLVARQLGEGDAGAGAAEPTASPSQEQSGGSRTASPSQGPTASPSESPSASAPAGEVAAKEQTVRDYYAAAPGGTDEAWAMLGPSLQAQGRASYDRFWRGIESVDVQQVGATEGSDDVRVRLVYTRADGSTSTENKVEGLVEDGEGGWLIDTDRAG